MGIDRRLWRPLIVIAAAAALSVSACGSSGGSGTTPAPAPTPSPTGAATSGPAQSGQAQSACADVVAKGQALAATGLGLVNGSASRDQVNAAAQDLSTSLNNAKADLTPAVSAHANDVQNDIGKLVDALKAEPIDTAGVRAAASALAGDLRDLANVCGTPISLPPTS